MVIGCRPKLLSSLTCRWLWLDSAWSLPMKHTRTTYLCGTESRAWRKDGHQTAGDPYTMPPTDAPPPAANLLPAPLIESQDIQRLEMWKRERESRSERERERKRGRDEITRRGQQEFTEWWCDRIKKRRNLMGRQMEKWRIKEEGELVWGHEGR